MQIVSDEIYRIVEREVSNYVAVAPPQIEKEYVYGPSDLIIFKKFITAYEKTVNFKIN